MTVKTNPSCAEVDFACMAMRDDFSSMTYEEREVLRFEAREWLQAWLSILDEREVTEK